MHFQIFLPGVRGQSSQFLIDAGLGDLADGRCDFMDVRGPEGDTGVIAAWRTAADADKRMGFFPDCQTWIKQEPEGRYWVGLWNGKPPSPAELARSRQFEGKAIALGDGNDWLIPSAARMPRDIVLRNGQPVFVLQQQFEDFWRESQAYFVRFLGASAVEGELLSVDGDWWNYLLRALRLNYRITPEVASELRLFTTELLIEAALATIDGHDIQEVSREKKTVPTPVC